MFFSYKRFRKRVMIPVLIRSANMAPLQLLDGSPIVTGIDSDEFEFIEDGLEEPGR